MLTQIARTHSLRRQFGEAHALLDEVEPQLGGAGPAPRTRYLLERGRTFNSAGDKARAAGLFRQAWETASAARLEGLAVDAAHMLAIVEPPASAAVWTQRGVEVARASTDAKARGLLPALLNNHAWNLHDDARYDEALLAFREAETAWHATGRQPQGRIATWSVAHCLRSLQRYEEALQLQLRLEQEWQVAGERRRLRVRGNRREPRGARPTRGGDGVLPARGERTRQGSAVRAGRIRRGWRASRRWVGARPV